MSREMADEDTNCGDKVWTKQAICIDFCRFQKRESIESVNLTATAGAAVKAFLIFSGTHETGKCASTEQSLPIRMEV